ncbi:ACP S-malonyltransferase [Salinibius halmophilus]|uniref:ACP S-malonyltransferase n=1 Tax=Salinibius halmophilus TaxID=1853216 RepID=UPI000E670FF6|nr:ACP S-malonyltransferase [Salinibius halmophilus]
MTTAFVFPGQGSQTVGMLADVAEKYSVVTDTFAEASEALGYDLWALVQDGPAEELGKTEKTQPALLTASVALFRVLQQEGVAAPVAMAGHSLGEYSALVCAGAIEFKDAVKLVELRGQLMQQAVPAGVGAMAAILGLTDEQVEEVCGALDDAAVVQAVNYNSPGQVVIAGHKEAVDAACERAKEAGAKRALPLPVSVPSHCVLMKPAAEKLAQALKEVNITAPSIPVLHNVDGDVAESADLIREKLIAQLYQPVLWAPSVNKLAEQGVETLVEVGPGKVLAGLAKRINRALGAQATGDAASLAKYLEA